MGQAKQRKAEITALKARNSIIQAFPNRKLMQAGFFYEQDKPNGIGFTMDMREQPYEAVKHFELSWSEDGIAEYIKGMIDETGCSKEELIKEFKEQLDCMRRPYQMTFSNSFIASMNICALVALGALEQDEYNGNSFMWNMK